MSDSDTANSGGSLQTLTFKYDNAATTWVAPADSARRTEGLIRCGVGFSNELILTPLTDLGASILAQFQHGDHVFMSRWSGRFHAKNTYGREVQGLVITQKTRPMLSSGDDPFFTGMTISPDEQQACRALIEKLRAAKNRPTRRRKKGHGR